MAGIVALRMYEHTETQAAASAPVQSKGFRKPNINKVGRGQMPIKLTKRYSKSLPMFGPLDHEERLPMPSLDLSEALAHQTQLLEYANKDRTLLTLDDSLIVNNLTLMTVAKRLQAWNDHDNVALSDMFDTYLLQGRDRMANVKFTSYYSPVIEVSAKPFGEYQVPIYQRPAAGEGELIPTRGEINNGALQGKGLAIAYAKSHAAVRNLQMQGSGFARFTDGSVKYLAYDGTNQRNVSNSLPARKASLGADEETQAVPAGAHRSPKYVFFRLMDRRTPIGAGSVALTPEISIAVDPRYIPLGASLLVEMPILDDRGRFLHHEYRILLAQDTGGAIKGPGHIDYYMGVGEQAAQRAKLHSHYGRVWLLLPKK